MRRTLQIAGILLIVVGGVWIGQGFGYVGGSFMTGQRHWAAIGALAVAAGLFLVLFNKR